MTRLLRNVTFNNFKYSKVFTKCCGKCLLITLFLYLLFITINYKDEFKTKIDEIDSFLKLEEKEYLYSQNDLNKAAALISDERNQFLNVEENDTFPNSQNGFSRPVALKSGKLKIIRNFIDQKRKSRILWSSDQECSKYDVRFGKHLPLAYLVSFPRSGNTWVRYLMEASTGLFTGSVYNSKALKRLGYLGETENTKRRSVIIRKMHDFNLQDGLSKSIIDDETPIVLLMRNPQRSILSYWHFLSTNSSHFGTVEDPWNTNEYKKYVYFTRRQSRRWNKLYSTYLKTSKNLLVIFYENIVENPIEEISKIVEFLGFQTEPQRLKCVEKYIQGPVKRNHSQELLISPETQFAISKAMNKVLDILHMKGLTPPDEYRDVTRLKE